MAKLSIGGQAVIEGVMMRGPKDVAVAVRKADGTIDVDVKPVNSIADRYPILKKPLLRGVVALVEPSAIPPRCPARKTSRWTIKRWP